MYVQVPATTAVPLSLHAGHIDPDPGIIRPTTDLSSLKGTNTCPRSTQSKPSELVLKRARIPTQREGADGTVERFHGHLPTHQWITGLDPNGLQHHIGDPTGPMGVTGHLEDS